MISTMIHQIRCVVLIAVEEVLQERVAFAEMVKEIAEPDVESMGIRIVSFTIREISDELGYLKALGRTRIAEVKREADIATAENNKLAGIHEVYMMQLLTYIVYILDTVGFQH